MLVARRSAPQAPWSGGRPTLSATSATAGPAVTGLQWATKHAAYLAGPLCGSAGLQVATLRARPTFLGSLRLARSQ
eukprot:5884847-Alexandrium_andersonii.AAC.1